MSNSIRKLHNPTTLLTFLQLHLPTLSRQLLYYLSEHSVYVIITLCRGLKEQGIVIFSQFLSFFNRDSSTMRYSRKSKPVITQIRLISHNHQNDFISLVSHISHPFHHIIKGAATWNIIDDDSYWRVANVAWNQALESSTITNRVSTPTPVLLCPIVACE